jgi:hypothetical protein
VSDEKRETSIKGKLPDFCGSPVDQKSLELADYFLKDKGASKVTVHFLAEAIQEAVEDWFEDCGVEP